MAASSRSPRRIATRTLTRHPALQLFVQNIARDNIGMLAGFVSWSILTSIIPLSVAVVAIFGAFVQSPSAHRALVQFLSRFFQGAISVQDIEQAVKALSSNTGVLSIAGVIGIFWGASNIGGSFSGAFRIIFSTRARPFLREKLIDIGMLFIFTGLMGAVLFGTIAAAFLDRFASQLPFPTLGQVLIVTALSLISAFLLFGAIYAVFPNIEASDKFRHVWRGALPTAIIFEVVSAVWPLYVRLSHASRFGAVLFSLVVLTAWIYAFSMILLLGAELIAVASLRERQQTGARAPGSPQAAR